MAAPQTGPDRTSTASSRASSRAAPYSRSASTPPLSPHLLFLRNLLGETLTTLNFNNDSVLLPNDADLRDLSTGETCLIPLLCTALTGIAHLSTHLDAIQLSVDTLSRPDTNAPALTSLRSSMRDLSARVTAMASARHSQPTLPTAAPPNPARATNLARPQPQPNRPKASAPAAPPAPPYPLEPTAPTYSTTLDYPSYDTEKKKWFGNPASYAARFPRSWEAQQWRDGKYPPLSEFLPYEQPAPQAPPQPSFSRPTFADIISRPSSGQRKKRKGKNVATAAQVAASSDGAFPTRSSPSLPAADRRFFAPRQTAAAHQDVLSLAASAKIYVASDAPTLHPDASDVKFAS